ncbi:uncharacterized protein B0I36DRAFT_328783 [Microdochium trichocladiopsis]|uniref:DUF4396 domain-containing protein n=1 Tax=Microdochium trichocladiopsis TaxID=1682393 RepID=A0A9P9BLK8_9PEZI|nr:uncharacterized protein B0I36DRAFT_328783 [Microdochium trichocladiopsis]KAH7028192.1 hypothetical protein B0I36DRAFT_328783 [Microdochium trichocladiopsis]
MLASRGCKTALSTMAYGRLSLSPRPSSLLTSHLRFNHQGFRHPTRWACSKAKPTLAPAGTTSRQTPTSSCHSEKPARPLVPPMSELSFWTLRSAWRRASVNTLRCLVGCTVGDFSAMWTLQTVYPELGMGTIMAASMAAGIASSMTLETVLLRMGRDGLTWPNAFKTAAGMSFISMLTMEAAENAVDYYLTGGVVAFGDPSFWLASVAAIAAGFLAPLPYNYFRLRKYSKACH